MKRLLSILLALGLAAPVFAADAANDLILTQRKADNSGNVQRNLAPSANGFFTFDASKIPTGSPLGTGILTALGTNVGSAGAPVIFNGALGTPSSGVATNLTGNSGLTGVGALTSGSIGSGFGSINVGANSITGGAISGTTGTFTKATAGDVIIITNGGASNKTGYLYTDATYVSLSSGALLTGNAVYLDNVANTVGLQTGGATRALITSTGLNNTAIGATTPSTGAFTTLSATTFVKLPSLTVASLTAATTAGQGAMAEVTDATATTRLSTVVGGGSNKVIVFSDGTNWLIL